MCVRSHYALIDLLNEDYTPLVHFVGFRGEEYRSAVRVFGLPDVIHRAAGEVARADSPTPPTPRVLHPTATTTATPL